MLALIPTFARAQDDGKHLLCNSGSANQLGQEMNKLFQEEAKMQANLQQVVAPGDPAFANRDETAKTCIRPTGG